MGYVPDLSKITLPEYRELLKRQTLLPGRRILHDAVDYKL